ncbi:aldo/keto reductase [Brevibacillus migulae]|uniref:aldo/keto reductase n=1 Tax=Brevibacillus migulae TaxID=1644114 RepID=UPI00106E3C97|nr:aldo/keto reductase [Brevibacillus migulae]
MKSVNLGNSGMEVSAMSLGCMYFGTKLNEGDSFALLDHYYEAGGRFLDTANNYAIWAEGGRGGESEAAVGQWLKERGNRHEMVIATKVGAMPTIPGTGLEHVEGLSAKAIEKAVDESLIRLGTDYIDLYYAHIDDRQTRLEETLEAFDRLVRAGKVRQIGCSNMMTWRIEQAKHISHSNGWAAYCCVQQRYSYLRPKAGADFGLQVVAGQELLDYCKTNEDMTLVAYSPLLHGAYTDNLAKYPVKYVTLDNDARYATLEKVAQEKGATKNQVVLAWMLQSTPRVIPVIGVSTLEQLQENLGAFHVELSAAEMKELNEAMA